MAVDITSNRRLRVNVREVIAPRPVPEGWNRDPAAAVKACRLAADPLLNKRHTFTGAGLSRRAAGRAAVDDTITVITFKCITNPQESVVCQSISPTKQGQLGCSVVKQRVDDRAYHRTRPVSG